MIPLFVSDAMWNCIGNIFSQKKRGRPRIHTPRLIFEALMYIARTGCQWRLLPDCYPPWKTVHWHFIRWANSGKIDVVLDRLRRLCRKMTGKDHRSTIGIIDSQSVKTTRCAATKGYDGNKKVKGHKRHFLVDSLGLLISVVVTRANVHDLRGGRYLVHQIQNSAVLSRIRKIFADSAYVSLEQEGIPVEISANLSNRFSPLPQRWKAERSISWLQPYRRTSVDYERHCFYAEMWVKLAFIGVAGNRIK
jgi:putative transposase